LPGISLCSLRFIAAIESVFIGVHSAFAGFGAAGRG
jgi:hypothetical protein